MLKNIGFTKTKNCLVYFLATYANIWATLVTLILVVHCHCFEREQNDKNEDENFKIFIF